MSNNIFKNVDKQQFEQTVKSLENNQVILMKFTAEWCGPCTTIKPLCDSIDLQHYSFPLKWSTKRWPKPDHLLSIDINGLTDLNAINQSFNEVFIYSNMPLCQETCYSLLIWKRKSTNTQLKCLSLILHFNFPGYGFINFGG